MAGGGVGSKAGGARREGGRDLGPEEGGRRSECNDAGMGRGDVRIWFGLFRFGSIHGTLVRPHLTCSPTNLRDMDVGSRVHGAQLL